MIDGYGSDWTIIKPIEDEVGDSADPDIDITAYYSSQDENFLDIMLQAKAPIRKNYVVLELLLWLQTPDGKNQAYEFVGTTGGMFQREDSWIISSTINLEIMKARSIDIFLK